MWFAVATAIAAPRMVSVTETVELEAPVALAWTKLATTDGLMTIEGAEPLPEGEGKVLDVASERVRATDDGAAGVFVVVAIDGPNWIQIRWEPDDELGWRVIDLVLRTHRQGTEIEATVAYPADDGRPRRDVTDELVRGLEAFRASVDGTEPRG